MGLKILIVEDDRHVRRILETLFVRDPEFAALEPTVLVASDGTEGLRVLQAEHPDIVITDLLMPNMDGFQFCRAVRDDPQAGGCTLIVMSAVYKDPGLIAKLKAELGVEFFAKPFQVRDLVRTVRRRLKEAQAARHAADVALTVSDTTQKLAPVTAPMLEAQRGAIAQRPVPRLLLDCHETQATGTLTIRRGTTRKDIYLLVGHPIGVESTLRSETLGVYLVQRRILTEMQVREALGIARERGLKFGQALVAHGLLGETDVLQHLQAQVRYKLVTSLRWSEGEWQFVPGDTFSDRMTKSTVEPVRVVFSGLRRTARVELIQGALTGVERLNPTPRATRYADAWRRVFGESLLNHLADHPKVEDVLFDLPPVEALPQIDALVLCGMATLEVPPRRIAKTPSKSPDPFKLDDLGRRSSGVMSAIRTETAPLDELFGTEESRVGPPSGVHRHPSGIFRRPSEPNAPAVELAVQESGVIEIEPPPKAAPDEQVTPSAPDPRAEAIRKRIAQVYLTLHDADYYALLSVDRNATFDQIAEAFTRLAREFKLEQFAPFDLGRDYTRLEELNVVLRKAFETLSDPIKRLEYDRQRTAPPRRDDPFEAELLFRQGEERLGQGDAAGAIPLLEQAVARRQNHAEYHALLGWARLRTGTDTARIAAAGDIARALAMEPDLPAGHEYAGRLASQSGDLARAFDHLERSLDADPQRETALEAYEQLCAGRKEWRRLEKQYRKLIHRVGERDRDFALGLWWRLGDTYRVHLEDRDSARVSYEVAARLAPDEPQLQEALAQVTGGDPARWRETARAMVHRWRLAPADPAPLLGLYDLHSDARREEPMVIVAGALVARGAARPVHRDIWESQRPKEAPALRGPLSREQLARLVHADDDPDIGALFAVLAPVVHALDPLSPADLGAGRVAAGDAALESACRLLGVEVPRVYIRDELGESIHPGATVPPILLCGPRALGGEPTTVAARAGRAASFLLPGRTLGGALPSRQLKKHLLAAMTLAVPGLRVEDEDGSIAALREALARTPTDDQFRVRELVERVTRQKTIVNLSRWSRALARTADRVALLCSGDVVAASRVAREAGGGDADVDLLEFALGDVYLELRTALTAS
jgi:CheY-like chemotaxis protein